MSNLPQLSALRKLQPDLEKHACRPEEPCTLELANDVMLLVDRWAGSTPEVFQALTAVVSELVARCATTAQRRHLLSCAFSIGLTNAEFVVRLSILEEYKEKAEGSATAEGLSRAD